MSHRTDAEEAKRRIRALEAEVKALQKKLVKAPGPTKAPAAKKA